MLAALVAGGMLPFAFAPYHQFYVAPLSYAALFVLWRGASAKAALGLGFAYGLAAFAAGTYWTYISVHEYGNSPVALAVLLSAGLIAVLAAFVAVVGYAAARSGCTRGAAAWLCALPALWVIVEWSRGWLFTGFGWLSAGYSQTGSWAFGLAPVLGQHGVGWVVLETAGALVTLALGGRRARCVALVVLAVLWGGGYVLGNQQWTEPRGSVRRVALVQGAVPQDLKWRPEQLEPTMRTYRRLTETAAGNDLVVWPEAAIPALYSRVEPYLDGMADWARANDTEVMLGILRGGPDGTGFQNTLVALGEPPEFYFKRHLVPFGEYFPVPGFVRDWMRLMSLPYVDATPGPPEQPPLGVAGERIAVTICYEDVFGAEQLHSLPEATLLVNISNDAWFGDSIAPAQHLQISRMRAAEAGRYLLRATNTGITAVIDPRGRVVESLPQFEAGVLESTVQGFTGATPYARVGNYPVVTGAALVLAVTLGGGVVARRWAAARSSGSRRSGTTAR